MFSFKGVSLLVKWTISLSGKVMGLQYIFLKYEHVHKRHIRIEEILSTLCFVKMG